ncbi:GH25 family lysozyme [Streptomyces sp. ADI98-10]|uniref:GH25 family lysozyme n=1 Tax=Streptomyces sp. ADI98-10 TaxID=1522763 RepID=UPI000F550C44|nr:GH25 family lysozyme [Streptomyces sp. ADI98-10]RPK80122.1 Glycosyl hydrolases family 25 [Streptomyces sp. ADI98-10]
MLHGVDVNAYQTSYDTDGLDIALIRSTEGRTYGNPRPDSQVERARHSECANGFHHFLRPGDVADQVAYFMSRAPEKAGDLLAVDREPTGGGTRASNADKDRFIRGPGPARPGRRGAPDSTGPRRPVRPGGLGPPGQTPVPGGFSQPHS